MVGNVNNNASPMDALKNLFGSVNNEAKRAVGEVIQHKVDDVGTIGTAIETGGFLAGFVQAADVFSPGRNVANVLDAATGPGAMDPATKEGISAITNWVAGGPIGGLLAVKDLMDMATAPTTPGVAPAPANSVPGPDVGQLRGEAPAESSRGPRSPADGRSGYSDAPGPRRSREDIQVVAHDCKERFDTMTVSIDDLRNNPDVKARYPLLADALEDPNASLQDISMLTSAYALRDNPEVFADVVGRYRAGEFGDPVSDDGEPRFTIPSNERGPAPVTNATGPAPAAGVDDVGAPTPPAPAAPSTGAGDFSDFANQAMGMLGQLAGPLGMGMQFVGGLLANPLVSSFLAPLLVQGLNLIAPGLGVAIAPILPVALPIVGSLLSGAGGMIAGQAGGAPGGLPGAAGQPGAAPGAASLGDLGGLINGAVGLFGAVGGGAPALPVGV